MACCHLYILVQQLPGKKLLNIFTMLSEFYLTSVHITAITGLAGHFPALRQTHHPVHTHWAQWGLLLHSRGVIFNYVIQLHRGRREI